MKSYQTQNLVPSNNPKLPMGQIPNPNLPELDTISSCRHTNPALRTWVPASTVRNPRDVTPWKKKTVEFARFDCWFHGPGDG